MFKAFISLLFLSVVIQACKTQTSVDQSLIYSVINQVIIADSIMTGTICVKFDRPVVPDTIRKEFFATDYEFIQLQIKKAENARVDTGKIFYCNWCKHGQFKALIDSAYSDN